MKHLSHPVAIAIAGLFNSISVGEMMRATAREEGNTENFDLWDDHIGTAARTLRDNYGIRAIGASEKGGAIERLERREAKRAEARRAKVEAEMAEVTLGATA
jgi:hypothetical protein